MLHRFRTALPAWWGASLLWLMLVAAPAAAGPYSRLQVLLPGESAAPGSASGKIGSPEPQTVGTPFTVTVRACDSGWATVTSITNTVALSSSDATANLPAPASMSAGLVTFEVTLNATGAYTFTAADQGDPTIPDAVSASVSAFQLHGFEFVRINQKNQYAGAPMPITVTAVDAAGNPVAGFAGPVHLTEITSFGEGRISPNVVTFSGGRWSGNVTLYRADETAINRGNVNIYAYLESDPAANGTSDPFSVHPGPFARVQIIVPGESPLPGSVAGLTGTPASQAAGQLFSVAVYSTDAYWNPLPMLDVVRITSSDPAANTPVGGALVGGYRSFNVSLGTVGTQTLTVSDQTNGSIDGMTSAGIQVLPNAAARFVIETIPSPVSAGSPVAVTIRATDTNGNTIPNFAGNGILTANTGPGSISPESITFADGTWTGEVTFRGAGGAVAITCSDYATPPHTGSSNSIQVLPGPPAKLQIILPGQTPQGGTLAGFIGLPDDQNAGAVFNLTIRAVDAWWNTVPGVGDRIGLTSTDLFAGMPAETTLVNGQLTLPVRLYRGGNQTITATDLDNPGVAPHTSSVIRILPGNYARVLIVAPGEDLAPGTATGRSGAATDQSINFAFTVDVYATDAWWNPVPGPTDVVHLSSTDPGAQLPPNQAMADGVAHLVVRLSTGGFQQITATNVTQPSMPASTTQVRMISSGFHLEAEVYPTSVKAGEPFTLTVKVTNDAGSVIQEINSSATVEVQNASTRAAGKGTLLVTHFQILQGQRSVSETYTFAEPIILVARDDAGNVPAVTGVVTVSPGDPALIHLTSNPTWVRGNRHATISARVVDAYENGVPGDSVGFTLVDGGGTLTPVNPGTDENGIATADFHSARNPGIDRVRATCGLLSAELDIQTAFVDPRAPGGTITNYPNPFHPGEAPTTIAYVLADNASVTLKFYTESGGLVLSRTYPSGEPGGSAGFNQVTWDGRNGEGKFVASGGYLLVVNAEGQGETLHVMRRKIAVVR